MDGPVECDAGFAAYGSVVLRGARIGGRLRLSDAHLTRAGSVALHADNTVIDGRLAGGPPGGRR